MREIKAIPLETKAVDGRTVTTLFSVAGNLDSYTDRMWPGAFTKTIAERGKKVLHLWQHDFASPPIAVIKDIREVPREALPESVLAEFPQAMGGAEAVSEFLETPRADEVLKAIMAGSPLQASFAYDALKYDFTEESGKQIRNLREVRLHEISTVLWGANPATLGSKATIELLLQQVERFIKTGQRHSTADVQLINQIAQAAIDLGATNIKLTATDDSQDAAAAADVQDTDKSRAEPVSLTLERARLFLLEYA